jgi:hypothetical protein
MSTERSSVVTGTDFVYVTLRPFKRDGMARVLERRARDTAREACFEASPAVSALSFSLGPRPRAPDAPVPDENRRRPHDATATASSSGPSWSSLARSVAMCRATEPASLAAPATSIDANECRNGSPTK